MNYDIVFHVDSSDAKVLELAFSNVNNYAAALPNEKYSMVLVVNGPGVTLFKQDSAFAGECAAVQEKGLAVRLCANALKKFGIEAGQTLSNCVVVPAGVVELVHLQRQGFVYIKP